MSEVLARVTTCAVDAPRGPDVVHRIRVPRAWLESGATVELVLPRNLACAACAGGGCDLCERAGAITLRGRDELPELVQITLPARQLESDGRASSVVIRIPEHGGLARVAAEPMPRGLLLLRVELAELADPGVTRIVPPAPPWLERIRLVLQRLKPSTTQTRALLLLLALAGLIGLALLALWRHRGLG